MLLSLGDSESLSELQFYIFLHLAPPTVEKMSVLPKVKINATFQGILCFSVKLVPCPGAPWSKCEAT